MFSRLLNRLLNRLADWLEAWAAKHGFGYVDNGAKVRTGVEIKLRLYRAATGKWENIKLRRS